MSLSMAVGLLASGVFLARLLPQPIKLARGHGTAGVSPLAAANGVVNAIAWAVYGVLADLPIVWVVSVLALGPAIWTLCLLRAEFRRVDGVGVSCWIAVCVGAGLLGQLGFVLAASVLLTMGPQVVLALRTDDLSGIATTTLWISLLDAATWGAYGLVVLDPALMRYGVFLAACASLILARVRITERRGSQRRSVAAGDAQPRLHAEVV